MKFLYGGWRNGRQFFPFFDWREIRENNWSPRNSMEIELIGAEGRRQLLQRREGRKQATNPIKQQLNCAVWWMSWLGLPLLSSQSNQFKNWIWWKRESSRPSPIQSSISFNFSFLFDEMKELMKCDWMALFVGGPAHFAAWFHSSFPILFKDSLHQSAQFTFIIVHFIHKLLQRQKLILLFFNFHSTPWKLIEKKRWAAAPSKQTKTNSILI